MIRILQCVNIMDRAGLENMLMNYYRNIDRTKIQFDFLTHREEKGAYEDEIISMGGRVYHAPRLYPQNYPLYFSWMNIFFKEHPEYKIVHSHIDAMSYFPLLAAKKSGIPIRIAHSHSSKLDRDLKLPIKYFALKKLPSVANVYCACGHKAGKFMFGDRKFSVIHNAVDLKMFLYNEKIRISKRDELDIAGDVFVIGHVGRYCYIKNQIFLIDVFSKVLQEKQNSILLLIGNGPDEAKIKSKIDSLGISNKVKLLKNRDDVNELYQVMDVFVMPSLFEGLPVVGVEAQANGLPCIVSNKISKEVVLSDCIKMLDLEDGVDEWKNAILSTNTERSMNSANQLEINGYNVKLESNKITSYYNSLIEGGGQDEAIDNNHTNI